MKPQIDADYVSALGKRALDILLVANPRGTSLGILSGILCKDLMQGFTPVLLSITWFDFRAISYLTLVTLGVIMFNLQSYLQRDGIDPQIERALKYIEDQRRAGTIAKWHAQQMYINLHDQVLKSITIDRNAGERLKKR